MNMYDQVTIKEQECEDENYDFGIQVVATPNLLQKLSRLGGLSPQQILFIAHSSILEKYEGRNKDYLQICMYRGLEFWAISNKLEDEEYDPNIHCLTFLLGEDY